jgi:septal ring factor EnvC (AmiA/AmiB activator)
MPAYADDATCLDLAAQMQKLKSQVEALQARVKALEQAPNNAQTNAAPSTAGVAAEAAAQLRREDAAMREGWKQLKTGLTQEKVKSLLGAPQKTFMLSGKLVWYYYYPAVGGGSVMFDSNGHVVGHQAPPFSAFGLY